MLEYMLMLWLFGVICVCEIQNAAVISRVNHIHCMRPTSRVRFDRLTSRFTHYVSRENVFAMTTRSRQIALDQEIASWIDSRGASSYPALQLQLQRHIPATDFDCHQVQTLNWYLSIFIFQWGNLSVSNSICPCIDVLQ